MLFAPIPGSDKKGGLTNHTPSHHLPSPAAQVNAKGQVHATTKLGHYLRVEAPGGGGGGGGGRQQQHSAARGSTAGGGGGGGEGGKGGGGGGGEAPGSPLAGGASSSEFSFLQQLLDQ